MLSDHCMARESSLYVQIQAKDNVGYLSLPSIKFSVHSQTNLHRLEKI